MTMSSSPTSQVRLGENIKQVVVKSLSDTTCHGIPNLIRADRISIKIMWAVFVIISTGLCAFLIITNITDYLSYDVVTEIRDINEFPSIFPTISICNSNAFSTNYSIEYLRQVGRENGFPDIFNDTVAAQLEKQGTLSQIGQLYYFNGLGNFDKLNKSQKQALGYGLSDFVLSCQFTFESCNMSQFQWFFHNTYGNCFKFNSGFDADGNKVPFLYSSRSTTFEGLNLVMFSGLPDKLTRVSSGNVGMSIFIHNSSTSPLTVNPVSVRSNTQTNIGVTRYFSTKLSKPYSDCNFDTDDRPSGDSLGLESTELYDLIMKQGFDYTQIDCINQCFQKILIKRCNCTFFVLTNYFENYPQCIGALQVCAQNFYYEFNSDEFIRTNCFPLCPLECTSRKYVTSVSQYDYPTKQSENDMLLNDQIKKLYSTDTYSTSLGANLVSLNIYYSKLAYTSIEESPSIDQTTLFSNIGGIAGLFLGVSVLSVVEFLEILVEILFVFVRYARPKFETKRINDVETIRVKEASASSKINKNSKI